MQPRGAPPAGDRGAPAAAFLTGHGESARQTALVAIRSLGEWCLAHGLIDANPDPGKGLGGPRPYRREIRVLSVAKINRLPWGQTPGALPRDPRELRNRALLGVA
jgi:site-specific recombinase XerC